MEERMMILLAKHSSPFNLFIWCNMSSSYEKNFFSSGYEQLILISGLFFLSSV